jgi:pimeloyl-ACP methyl ester carboxylesterase
MRLTRRSVVAGLALAGCAGKAAAATNLTFTAADGAPLSGKIYGKGRHAVLLVPGGHGVGETWHLQAQRLARAGFKVLAMDYRGRGRSPGLQPDDEKAHLDVLGAVRHLKAEGADRISVVGASWGGWAAGTAAIAAPGLVERLVLLAHSPFQEPAKLGGRKLFIVAQEDRVGSGDLRLKAIRDQYDAAPNPKELMVLPGAAHAQFLFLTSHAEHLYREILRFLSAP